MEESGKRLDTRCRVMREEIERSEDDVDDDDDDEDDGVVRVFMITAFLFCLAKICNRTMCGLCDHVLEQVAVLPVSSAIRNSVLCKPVCERCEDCGSTEILSPPLQNASV